MNSETLAQEDKSRPRSDTNAQVSEDYAVGPASARAATRTYRNRGRRRDQRKQLVIAMSGASSATSSKQMRCTIAPQRKKAMAAASERLIITDFSDAQILI